jgi:hypothetical protein
MREGPEAWVDKWTAFHFTQANPEGAVQEDVPALLRRIADSIEELGSPTIANICFQSDLEDEGWRPSMTVYYTR